MYSLSKSNRSIKRNLDFDFNKISYLFYVKYSEKLEAPHAEAKARLFFPCDGEQLCEISLQ